ncbi:hypothetical protein MACH05_24990 [Qipengyuania nanhaisediminis]
MISHTKLRHIVAVDRAGSITAAAKALHVTQSSVTKSVAEIEREVGHALFERKSRGVIATAEGREFLDRAARIVTDLDLLLTDTQDEAKAREAIFRLGVSPPSIEGLLNRALCQLVKDRPSMRLQVSSAPVEQALRSLRRGDLDALIGPTDFMSGESSIAIEPVSSIKARLFCRKGHPLTKHRKVTPRDVIAYSIVTPDVSSDNTDALRELYTKAGKHPERFLHHVENFATLADMVASTDLLAIVSEAYSDSAAFRSRFAIVDLDVFSPMELSCGFSADRQIAGNLAAFLRSLKAHPPS